MVSVATAPHRLYQVCRGQHGQVMAGGRGSNIDVDGQRRGRIRSAIHHDRYHLCPSRIGEGGGDVGEVVRQYGFGGLGIHSFRPGDRRLGRRLRCEGGRIRRFFWNGSMTYRKHLAGRIAPDVSIAIE